ncbi:MAG: hypothetical protein ACW9XH_08100 [Candidatus Nitrosopumilus sp. bin_32a]
MGTEEIPHIDKVNETLNILLSEVRLLNQTMQGISTKLDQIANSTHRIP